LSFLFRLQKDDGVGGDAFSASGESEVLGGRRFDVDPVGIDLESSGNGDSKLYQNNFICCTHPFG